MKISNKLFFAFALTIVEAISYIVSIISAVMIVVWAFNGISYSYWWALLLCLWPIIHIVLIFYINLNPQIVDEAKDCMTIIENKNKK